jgi:hypothetical protein
MFSLLKWKLAINSYGGPTEFAPGAWKTIKVQKTLTWKGEVSKLKGKKVMRITKFADWRKKKIRQKSLFIDKKF